MDSFEPSSVQLVNEGHWTERRSVESSPLVCYRTATKAIKPYRTYLYRNKVLVITKVTTQDTPKLVSKELCHRLYRNLKLPTIREENLLQMVLWKMVHFALFLVKISINFSPGYSTVFFFITVYISTLQ
jgi:hypothetical protein